MPSTPKTKHEELLAAVAKETNTSRAQIIVTFILRNISEGRREEER